MGTVCVRGSYQDEEAGVGELLSLCFGGQVFGYAEPSRRVQIRTDRDHCRMNQSWRNGPDDSGNEAVKRIVADTEERRIIGHVAVVEGRERIRSAVDLGVGGICAICVHPDWRGQGIGMALLNGFRLYSNGRHHLAAGFSSRDELGAFYQRAGYGWDKRGQVFYQVWTGVPDNLVRAAVDALHALPNDRRW